MQFSACTAYLTMSATTAAVDLATSAVAPIETGFVILAAIGITGGGRCYHVWPGELDSEAGCELCGMAYLEWSV